jgi:hypothetical protein
MKKLFICVLAAAIGVAAIAEPSLRVSIRPGAAYESKAKFGLISITVIPQMAIWIETAEGKYVDTIYVTRKSATSSWSSAGGARRPEALPIWSHARGVAAPDGLYMPDKAHRLPDSISGATPGTAFSKAWKVSASLAPGKYRIRVELNSSFDWNAAYPDKLPKADPRWNEVNGQPSIVWEAVIAIGGAAASSDLAPVGTGALRGDNGAVTPGLAGITSAKDLAASIRAEYLP